MKKNFYKIAILLMLVALLTTMLAACDKRPFTVYVDPPEYVPPHAITLEKDGLYDEYYQLDCNKDEAVNGAEVQVNFVDEYGFLDLDGIFVNGEKCESYTEPFTFVMPDEDVTVTADISVADVAETEDGLKWGVSDDTLNAGSGAMGEFNVHFGEKEISNAKQFSQGKVLMYYVDVFSTDQDVIPDSAIVQVLALEAGASYGMATGAIVYISCVDISPGETTLVFVDKTNKRAITHKVTVVGLD